MTSRRSAHEPCVRRGAQLPLSLAVIYEPWRPRLSCPRIAPPGKTDVWTFT